MFSCLKMDELNWRTLNYKLDFMKICYYFLFGFDLPVSTNKPTYGKVKVLGKNMESTNGNLTTY